MEAPKENKQVKQSNQINQSQHKNSDKTLEKISIVTNRINTLESG